MKLAAVRSVPAWLLTLALVAAGLAASASPAQAQSRFSDTEGSVHAAAIELIAAEGITSGFPDGTYRPRGDVRRDQMATFLTAALDLEREPADFPDVPSDSVHYTAIGALAASGITTGFTDGTFRPRGFVTRGQMATFLTKGLELPPGSRTFRDVPRDYVHADAIAALAASGITEGFGDGTFRPNALVKRDQMASFLVRGLGLIECPPETDSSVSTSTASTDTASTATAEEPATADAGVAERGSEDLEESSQDASLDDVAPAGSPATTSTDHENLGPAVPPVFFPVTSAIKVGNDLEVHSFSLPDSRSVRVSPSDQVKATTTNAAGRRTWATASIGDDVFVGQWGAGSSPNLWRYRSPSDGERRAVAIADVPDGGEFWTLAAQGTNRLWAGTRAHAGGTFRRSIGLGTRGDVDNRHVVHRIDLSQSSVRNLLFEAPCMPTLDSGLRPDVKQVDTSNGTLYVGLGQQTGGARLYAFEPGNRLDIPQRDVRLISPDSVASASGIFALEVDDDHIAFGTQGGSGVDPRLVVLDRRTEQVRVDVPLPDENRVDAIAIDGGTVVASANSGRLYRVSIPTSGTHTSRLMPIAAPVADQLNRYVEITSTGLRGVTNQGVVWTRSPGGAVSATNLIDAGAPGAPGEPHSLHTGGTELAVGTNAALTLRPLASVADAPRTVSITGEGKALASGPDGDTFAAVYPHAQLWRVASGGSDAVQIAQWEEAFLRPADAVYDDRGGPSDHRVRVLAREDNAPRSGVPVPGRTDDATMQLRPSRLFSLRPDGTSVDEELEGLTLAGDPAWEPADDDDEDERAAKLHYLERNPDNLVEARAVAVPATGPGAVTYVGDSFGGVQAVDPTAAEGDQQDWYHQLGGDTPRPIVDLDVVDGRVVVTASGTPAGTNSPDRTVVYELDPLTGAIVPETTFEFSGRVYDAVTSGARTVFAQPTSMLVYDRTAVGDAKLQVLTTHERSETFGGPFVALDPGGCDLFGIAARDLFRTQLPGCGPPLED